MNKRLFLSASCMILPVLCGCTAAPPESQQAASSDAATAATAEPASTSAETAAACITDNTSAASSDAPASETAAAITTVFQGGIGGEQYADTPSPEYFSYRFQPDALSVRQAGGTYQIVSCDLSAAFAHDIDAEYRLADHNADGAYDLFIPAAYHDDTITEYLVFLWNPDEKKFLTEPVTVSAVT